MVLSGFALDLVWDLWVESTAPATQRLIIREGAAPQEKLSYQEKEE